MPCIKNKKLNKEIYKEQKVFNPGSTGFDIGINFQVVPCVICGKNSLYDPFRDFTECFFCNYDSRKKIEIPCISLF